MRFLISLLLLSFSLSLFAAWESDMMSSVLKIKVYEKDTISGNYSFSHWGSAIIINKKTILTNAHVILDSNGKEPTGYYELCRYQLGKKNPVCFTTAKLLQYDTITDIASLEVAGWLTAVRDIAFSDKKLDIGSSMIVYGYPGIGWSNITRTEWKIGWTEWEKYKFDGTIDHWNSGGWAFDTTGKLIGMPYAVSSDNGVIGYVISVETLKKFLSGKSYGIEKFTSPKTTEFAKYVKDNQLISKNSNLIKTKYVEIKDMEKSWFFLNSVVSSLEGRIFDYRFIDINERVAIRVACSKDATGSKTISQIIEESLDDKDKPLTTNVTWRYLDMEKRYFLLEAVAVKETNWQKSVASALVPTYAPTCAVWVLANDGQKKDKELYQKGITLGKNIKFLNPLSLSSSFDSSFFSLSSLPKNVYIGEGTKNLDTTIQPNIYFSLGNDYSTSSNFELGEFDTKDDYMNMYYGEDSYYKSSDYSFDAFYQRYRSIGDTSMIEEVMIQSKNKKKMIISAINTAQGSTDQNLQKTKVIIFYPFQDVLGKYRFYRFVFEFASSDRSYIEDIRSFFQSIDLPWTSPFTN